AMLLMLLPTHDFLLPPLAQRQEYHPVKELVTLPLAFLLNPKSFGGLFFCQHPGIWLKTSHLHFLLLWLLEEESQKLKSRVLLLVRFRKLEAVVQTVGALFWKKNRINESHPLVHIGTYKWLLFSVMERQMDSHNTLNNRYFLLLL